MQPREQMLPSNDRAQVFLDVEASRFLRKTKQKTNQTKQTDQNKQQNQPTKNSNTQTNQPENPFLLMD